jgi:hypothetical protein
MTINQSTTEDTFRKELSDLIEKHRNAMNIEYNILHTYDYNKAKLFQFLEISLYEYDKQKSNSDAKIKIDYCNMICGA